jgi:hypothetical protein
MPSAQKQGSSIIKLHFASQVIVQKQQMYLGAKTAPPGKSGRAVQLPRVCAGCGCFTTCTGTTCTGLGGNSSRRLLKDRPHKLTPADTKPNQWDSQGPVVSKSLECPQTSTRRSWVSRARAAHSSSVRQVTTTELCKVAAAAFPTCAAPGFKVVCPNAFKPMSEMLHPLPPTALPNKWPCPTWPGPDCVT